VLEVTGPGGERVPLDEVHAFDPSSAGRGAPVATGAVPPAPIMACTAANVVAFRPWAHPRPRRACSLKRWR
jgi:hypothetical protein